MAATETVDLEHERSRRNIASFDDVTLVATMPDDGMTRLDRALAEFREVVRILEVGGWGDLVCVECRVVDDGERGWRTYLTVDDELATYCPDCAREDFGDA